MSKVKRLIIQFAKEPVAGKVKTRLLSEFSLSETVDLHCELVLATADTLLKADADSVYLSVGGDLTHPFFAPFKAQGFTLVPQVEGDLGVRMWAAINQALGDFDQVLLVGSDCPVLTVKVLDQAFKVLSDGYPLVLNPAEDGGYVLIGACRPLPIEVFSGVHWGTATVLEQTLENCIHADVRVSLLPELWDVDHPEDVRRWLAIK